MGETERDVVMVAAQGGCVQSDAKKGQPRQNGFSYIFSSRKRLVAKTPRTPLETRLQTPASGIKQPYKYTTCAELD